MRYRYPPRPRFLMDFLPGLRRIFGGLGQDAGVLKPLRDTETGPGPVLALSAPAERTRREDPLADDELRCATRSAGAHLRALEVASAARQPGGADRVERTTGRRGARRDDAAAGRAGGLPAAPLDGERDPDPRLTARHEVSDRIAGLDAAPTTTSRNRSRSTGSLRLRALLRHPRRGPLSYADVSVDPLGHRAWHAITVSISHVRSRAARAFRPLGRARARALSRSSSPCGAATWARPRTRSRSSRLPRRKLEEGDLPRLIHTVHGIGYVIARNHDDRQSA